MNSIDIQEQSLRNQFYQFWEVNRLVELIQHAAEEAIMMLSTITPAGYMVYLQSLRHSWTQDWLSKSCYVNK